jgi:hypothetical protein
MKRIVWCLALAALASCADTPGEPSAVDQRADGIFGGLPPDAPMHRAVVSLHTRGGTSVNRSPFCSGTLIGDRVVLTAAHCVERARPATLSVYVGDAPLTDPAPHFFAAAQIRVHPAYDRRAIRNDLALIRLASPVPPDLATPVPVLPAALGFTAADVGRLPLDFAGFGVDERGRVGVKLHADGVLGSLGCGVDGCPDPGDAATQIAYGQGQDGPCAGDSGGPAFVIRDGAAYVGAVTSSGDARCRVYGVSTRADAFHAFVDPFLAGACGDGACGAGESCDGRAGTTACPADCPGTTAGGRHHRYCFVGAACTGPGCP